MLDKSMRLLQGIMWHAMILSITVSAWGATDDANLQTRAQTFRAQGLEVIRFIGQLRIEVEDRTDLAVQMRGVKADLDDIKLNVRNGTLHIEDQRRTSGGSTSVVTAGNVTAVASGGGTASINIGGQQFNAGGQYSYGHPAVEITVKIPTGIPLDLHDLNGDCHIGNTNGPVQLTLSSGNCTLGEITRGQLLVQGSGDIVTNQVSGDLRVGISGSGNIRVHAGQVGHLEATLNGSGDIDLGVRAQQAVLSLVGAGNIHVTHVRDRPQINLAGAGAVEVDNW